MLLASLAVHFSVAVVIAISYMHGASRPIEYASSTSNTPTVLLLRSRETPFLPIAPLVVSKPVATIPVAKPITPSPTPQPIIAKTLPTAPPPPALALETNPNAHIRPFAPDSILSPNPAPQLNSADGIVFILDISGSMYESYNGSTRIAFARETIARQIRALKDGTPFAITLYALNARTSGPLVAASDATREAAVRFVMRDVDCGGGTNLPAGLNAAQQLHPGSMVLVTDGDLNMPAYKLAASERAILGPQDHCPALSIIGIAPRESLRAERLLQGLADQQGGVYATAQLDGNAELVTSAANAIKPTSATP